MKRPLPSTRPDHLQPGRVRQPEHAETRVVARRTDDCDGFCEHDLVRGVRVEVEGGEEDCLGGVGVDLRVESGKSLGPLWTSCIARGDWLAWRGEKLRRTQPSVNSPLLS